MESKTITLKQKQAEEVKFNLDPDGNFIPLDTSKFVLSVSSRQALLNMLHNARMEILGMQASGKFSEENAVEFMRAHAVKSYESEFIKHLLTLSEVNIENLKQPTKE